MRLLTSLEKVANWASRFCLYSAISASASDLACFSRSTFSANAKRAPKGTGVSADGKRNGILSAACMRGA